MMRLARIVCVASDLGACVRSLPRPCKSVRASSNASQIVRVLLKLNANGFSAMRQSPHADVLRCENGGTLKSGLEARSLCDGGSITRRLRPPQSEVQLQFCDNQPLLTRCGASPLTPLNECSSAVTRSSAHNAPWRYQLVFAGKEGRA